jgi:hypothetical protein
MPGKTLRNETDCLSKIPREKDGKERYIVYQEKVGGFPEKFNGYEGTGHFFFAAPFLGAAFFVSFFTGFFSIFAMVTCVS